MALPKLWSKPFWGWYIIFAMVVFMLGPDQDGYWLYGFQIFEEFDPDWMSPPSILCYILPFIPLPLLFAYSLIKSED